MKKCETGLYLLPLVRLTRSVRGTDGSGRDGQIRSYATHLSACMLFLHVAKIVRFPWAGILMISSSRMQSTQQF